MNSFKTYPNFQTTFSSLSYDDCMFCVLLYCYDSCVFALLSEKETENILFGEDSIQGSRDSCLQLSKGLIPEERKLSQTALF